MLCHRCGSEVEAEATACANCGLAVKGGRRTFNRTLTSFRGLEQRRQADDDDLPARPGETIGGHFALEAVIGRGPLGVVYAARDRENRLDVALKLIDPALLRDDPARDAALTVLARARRLAHDGIVRVYAVGRDGDRLYIASERLDGLTLAKVLGLRRDKKQRFTVAEAAPIIDQINTALLHAHRHLPHGGVKPENILLLPTALKLTDFGIAAALPPDAYAAAHRAADQLDRIAPELRAGQTPTPRADIFGLGAILYEMLAGRPHAPDAPTLAAAIGRLDDAPHPMDAVIRRATATDPAKRYPTVEAFADAFATAVDTSPLPGDDDVTRRVAAEAVAHRLADAVATGPTDDAITAPNRVRPTDDRALDRSRDPLTRDVPATDDHPRYPPTADRHPEPSPSPDAARAAATAGGVNLDAVGATPTFEHRPPPPGRPDSAARPDRDGFDASNHAAPPGRDALDRAAPDAPDRAARPPATPASAPPPPPLEATLGAPLGPRRSANVGAPVQNRRSQPADPQPRARNHPAARVNLDPRTDPAIALATPPGRGGMPGTMPSVLFDPAVLTDLEIPPPPLGPATGEHLADDRTPTRPIRPLTPTRPWYLTNAGFALTIALLIGAAALATLYWINREPTPGPQVVARPETPPQPTPSPLPVLVEPVADPPTLAVADPHAGNGIDPAVETGHDPASAIAGADPTAAPSSGAAAPAGLLAPPGAAPALIAHAGAAPPPPGSLDAPGLAPSPGTADRPGLASSPAAADRPGLAPSPAAADRPGLTPSPAAADRVGTADRPGLAPGTADRPGLAPGLGTAPGSGTAPGTTAGPGSSPGSGTAHRTGPTDRLGTAPSSGSAPGSGPADRLGSAPDLGTAPGLAPNPVTAPSPSPAPRPDPASTPGLADRSATADRTTAARNAQPDPSRTADPPDAPTPTTPTTPRAAQLPTPPATATAIAPAPQPDAPPATAELTCPPTMRLLTRALPRGSVTRGTIRGDEAITLARQGQAFCIDAHEYPGAGRPPKTGVNFEAARNLCRQTGKRLCTDTEWRRACAGDRGAPFPYGPTFDAARCNTEDAEGEERALAASGTFKRCASPAGAYDMSGNVAEWTADQTVRGGDFASADDDATCAAGGKRAPSSARATIGFRCCTDFTDATP